MRGYTAGMDAILWGFISWPPAHKLKGERNLRVRRKWKQKRIISGRAKSANVCCHYALDGVLDFYDGEPCCSPF
jgi:hypothetical protein